MTFYDYRLLNNIESTHLRCLLEQYREYDKLDILIEIVVKDIEEFKNRKFVEKKEKVKINYIPESIKYCDGDKCSI